MRYARRGALVPLPAVALVALGWALYALVAWLRYGTPADRRLDALLDRFMPLYEVAERHETRVAAPAALAYTAACALDLRESGLVRAVFRGREILMRAPRDDGTLSPALIAQMLRLGWRPLAEESGRELVMGAVTQPWQARVVFEGLPPARFAAFDRPGYAQIAWTIAAEPLGPNASVVRTVTRVRTTDAASRARFRRYWAVYSPGILLIRVKARRARRGRAALPRGRDGRTCALPALTADRVRHFGASVYAAKCAGGHGRADKAAGTTARARAAGAGARRSWNSSPGRPSPGARRARRPPHL